MPKVILDDQVARALEEGGESEVVLYDASGRCLGVFRRIDAKSLSPLSDEEIQQRLKQCGTGRSLAEILADLPS